MKSNLFDTTNKMFIALLPFVVFLANVNGHTYHLGGCPEVEPQRNFDMTKMLGVWYAIEKTSTASSCIVYNFTKTDEPYVYELEQTSQHFALKYAPVENIYKYTGRLTVPDKSIPSKMSVKFPLNVGSSVYTIVSTDYTNYALIHTCQSLAFVNRRSATILSRDKILDKDLVLKLREILSDNEIDPHDLSIINQSNCPKPSSETHFIDIDDETLSAKSAGNVVRKAGDVIASGTEFVVDGAGTLIDKVRGEKNDKPIK